MCAIVIRCDNAEKCNNSHSKAIQPFHYHIYHTTFFQPNVIMLPKTIVSHNCFHKNHLIMSNHSSNKSTHLIRPHPGRLAACPQQSWWRVWPTFPSPPPSETKCCFQDEYAYAGHLQILQVSYTTTNNYCRRLQE